MHELIYNNISEKGSFKAQSFSSQTNEIFGTVTSQKLTKFF